MPSSTMELKVWVDGIVRVVSGATYATTCQDVVIALASAMDRTGRFSLVEKWRDKDRPMTPEECPLLVLQKWGELAGEVRFILLQVDSDSGRHIKDKLNRARVWKSGLPHNFTPSGPLARDTCVKRSLTFSGAHRYSAEWLNSSAPTSKIRKTHQGSVVNGMVDRGAECAETSRLAGNEDVHQHPVPPPRRRVSPSHLPNPDPTLDSRHGRASPVPVPSTSKQPGIDSKLPPHPPVASPRSHPASHAHDRSHPPLTHPRLHPVLHPQPLTPGQVPSLKHLPASRSPSPDSPPPLPSSPPPSRPSPRNHHSVLHPIPEQGRPWVAVETTLTSPDHSRQASLEIEEYDLERNFPDLHREAGRTERPSVSLEYRLEDGLASGSGSGGHLEGEHAKLVRLVNMQQERLKTQESQISLINTEISALEEKEKEYEEKLHVIMEELLLHENRQRDLEPELNDLERVEWDNVLDGEKKCEVDITLKIASLKAMILDHEHKLDDSKSKEGELLRDLKEEEEAIDKEKQHIQAEEAKAKEEENKMKEEISQIQSQCSQVKAELDDCHTHLSSVDSELKSVETSLEEKQSELANLEAELKEENLKDFPVQPAPGDSGETIIKILEGRLPPAKSSTATQGPITPPFITALTTKTQSGVWV